jgi:transcriptional regulator with XRE-family HTH domain
LSQRRYSYYARGKREPNLATLLLICDVLAATPNDLLLPEGRPSALSDRDRLVARITAAINNLDVADLELAACQLECLTAHRPRRAPSGTD